MSSKKVAKRTAAARDAANRNTSSRNATSRVERTLDEVENLVVNASHVPLTGKSMIDENDLAAPIVDGSPLFGRSPNDRSGTGKSVGLEPLSEGSRGAYR